MGLNSDIFAVDTFDMQGMLSNQMENIVVTDNIHASLRNDSTVKRPVSKETFEALNKCILSIRNGRDVFRQIYSKAESTDGFASVMLQFQNYMSRVMAGTSEPGQDDPFDGASHNSMNVE